MNLLHVGIQVIQDDVENFYVNVLGGILNESFKIGEQISEKIFAIPAETEVLIVRVHELMLELFMHKTVAPKSYAHFCLEVNNIDNIIYKAEQLSYKTVLHKSAKGTNTWFIYDNNNNIFELKSK